jgi:Na+/melibiose symporter-like transporter
VSYQAHGAEITDDVAERTRVTAWREGFALVGVFLAAALPEVLRQSLGEREGFARFAVLFAPLVLLAAAITILASPPAHSRRPPAGTAALGSFTIPMANASFRRLLAIFVLNGIAASIPATLVLFFIEDVVRRPDLGPVFLIAYFAAGAAGLPLWVWLSRRIGKGRAWLAAMGLSIAAFVWAFLLGPGDVAAYLAICVMSGIGLGADLALPPSLLADVIDGDEARGAGRHEGAYFGLWSLTTKLNLALAAGIALPLLQAFGYAPKAANSAESLLVLAAVYALLPCLLKLAAAAVLAASPFCRSAGGKPWEHG